MLEQIRPEQEEEAILAFEDAISSGHDKCAALRMVVSRFPACAVLIADYALAQSVERAQPNAEMAALEERVLRRADALLAARLATNSVAPSSPIDLASLLGAIKQRGIDIASFAQSTAIGMSILVKLDRRLLDISTVPRTLVESVAAALNVGATDVWRYLAKPPTLSPAASYRSRQSPEVTSHTQLESFRKAVATAVKSGELTQSDADTWQAAMLGPPDGA